MESVSNVEMPIIVPTAMKLATEKPVSVSPISVRMDRSAKKIFPQPQSVSNVPDKPKMKNAKISKVAPMVTNVSVKTNSVPPLPKFVTSMTQPMESVSNADLMPWETAVPEKNVSITCVLVKVTTVPNSPTVMLKAQEDSVASESSAKMMMTVVMEEPVTPPEPNPSVPVLTPPAKPISQPVMSVFKTNVFSPALMPQISKPTMLPVLMKTPSAKCQLESIMPIFSVSQLKSDAEPKKELKSQMPVPTE